MKKLFYLFVALLLFFAGQPIARVPPSGGNIKHKTAKHLSDPSDHFRSFQTGDWSISSTWESSPDGLVWSAATLIPGSAANTISIRNTHTVIVHTNEDMDQLVIESGAVLFHSSGTLTVNDGTGDDIIVQNGGIFTLASDGNGPAFSGSATAIINPGGMLRLSASGLTGAGTGVNAVNYIYGNASILEYTLIFAFSSAGVTYFPNVDAVTVPIFRITGNIGMVGAITNTAFNGVFEANGNITFQSSGTKTFRNGITGTGNIGHDGTSGKFIINGTTASLGGSGSLTLPAAGMDIGTTTTVTMVSDKSVTGNIAFLSNSFIILGAYNLTMTGSFSGYSSTSHVVTNGSGKVFINNIGVFPGATFPVGANTTTINPLIIFNGEGLNYGVRVETGINPAIAVPVQAVNRTWVVRPSANPAGTVNVNFFYAAGHGNAGFNYTTTVEQGFYTSVWNVINTGLTQFGMYQVTGTVNTFAANTDAPMVIANIGAILAVNNQVELTAQKQNDRTLLNWKALSVTGIENFIVERSANGRTYIQLAELPPSVFSFTDVQPLPGSNYYRIKMKDNSSKITNSNIALVLNAATGSELISISPNPVLNGHLKLNVSAAQKTQMEIVITDMQGRLVQKQMLSLIAGFSTIPVNIANLVKGTYQVYGNTGSGRSWVLRFVVQ